MLQVDKCNKKIRPPLGGSEKQLKPNRGDLSCCLNCQVRLLPYGGVQNFFCKKNQAPKTSPTGQWSLPVMWSWIKADWSLGVSLEDEQK